MKYILAHLFQTGMLSPKATSAFHVLSGEIKLGKKMFSVETGS